MHINQKPALIWRSYFITLVAKFQEDTRHAHRSSTRATHASTVHRQPGHTSLRHLPPQIIDALSIPGTSSHTITASGAELFAVKQLNDFARSHSFNDLISTQTHMMLYILAAQSNLKKKSKRSRVATIYVSLSVRCVYLMTLGGSCTDLLHIHDIVCRTIKPINRIPYV